MVYIRGNFYLFLQVMTVMELAKVVFSLCAHTPLDEPLVVLHGSLGRVSV